MEFSEIHTLDTLTSLSGQRLQSQGGGSSPGSIVSFWGSSLEFSNLWVDEHWEAHPAPRWVLVQPLGHGTSKGLPWDPIHRVVRCSAIDFSQFPSWNQSKSAVFLKNALTIILHSSCDSDKNKFPRLFSRKQVCWATHSWEQGVLVITSRNP